jgi:rhodanese-related sulfurtransferase
MTKAHKAPAREAAAAGTARTEIARRNYDYVRSRLLRRQEIAFLDVREEAPHAEGHPLFAANFPYSRIELDAYTKLPFQDVPIVTIDDGEGLAEASALRLIDLGYQDVGVFTGSIAAWTSAGGELFIDVNVPSKAFGELVETTCHTPSLSAEEVNALIASGDDMVIVDARRFDEYQTMSIPTAISVPGAELVLRVPDLAPSPETKIVVNCAGRTRSLLGAQSLINAGLPNSVAALRNGTIGWLLAEQELECDQTRKFKETPTASKQIAGCRARAVAERAGVQWVCRDGIADWARQTDRTTYFFDVRTQVEYEAGHLPGFFPIEGGQLVQETEMYAPVRGARIVLADDDGARANMTASWLAQMAWEVYVIEDPTASAFSEIGPWRPNGPAAPKVSHISPEGVLAMLKQGDDVVVVDFAKHRTYTAGHIPGAWYALRSRLRDAVGKLPSAASYVVTCPDGQLSEFVASELAEEVKAEVFVLNGGTKGWVQANGSLESGETHLASPPIDRYRRPYEGTNASREAMQGYLDWEFGLVEQLARDGTHHFRPLRRDGAES